MDKGRPSLKKDSVLLVVVRCGAEGGTRTPTVLLPPAPQAGASANSATSARVVCAAVVLCYFAGAGGRGGAGVAVNPVTAAEIRALLRDAASKK